MRLAGRPEILLNSKMHLNGPAREPAATASCERLGLREDSEAEYVAIERFCLGLATGRHSELDVIDGYDSDAHDVNPPTNAALVPRSTPSAHHRSRTLGPRIAERLLLRGSLGHPSARPVMCPAQRGAVHAGHRRRSPSVMPLATTSREGSSPAPHPSPETPSQATSATTLAATTHSSGARDHRCEPRRPISSRSNCRTRVRRRPHYELTGHARRSRSRVSPSASGRTRVCAAVTMKFASPTHRGTTWTCRCSTMPAPDARPRLRPRLMP